MRFAHALCVVMAAACASSIAAGAPDDRPERPELYAAAMDLVLAVDAPLYELAVPADVYARVVYADLADVRVFNAAREPVPHAFRPHVTAARIVLADVPLPLYPIRTSAPEGVAGVELRVDHTGERVVVDVRPPAGRDGEGAPPAPRLAGYFADASKVEGTLSALVVELPVGGPDVIARLTVEGSDDLRTWTTLARDAPVMRVTAGMNRLEQRRIPFAPARYQYLRISWPANAPALEIAALRGEPSATARDIAREWKDALAVPVLNEPGRYELDAGGRQPVDRLRFDLPQRNTIAAVTAFSRARPTEPWGFVAGATVYRLDDPGGEVRSGDLVVGATSDRHWRFDVDTRGGGIGTGELRVGLGWVPHRLVFAARGAPPFMLAFGRRDAPPAALPIATLVPGYGPETPNGNVTIAMATADPPYLLAGERATAERRDWKPIWLWTALVAGVGVLGWMAMRLARQMSPPPPPPPKKERRHPYVE
jgi:hypothetical protein